MCGRYALGIRAAFVRYQLQQQGLPIDNAPADEEVRETYNFPPGAYGLVYRADVPDSGLRDEEDHAVAAAASETDTEHTAGVEQSLPKQSDEHPSPNRVKYQLKAMKWGLIPFWTKRSPDYGSMMRTINCRDDSLIENKGMWTTMKQRKRCIVVAQGFFEWLKKDPGGKEKIPHFVKRKDGNLMCFAGLWDCVKYENAEDKLYTYSIITTDSNKMLTFLHDRMPVILEPGSEAMKLWLDPTQTKWTAELQSMLKPYDGELDCYPVNKDVGKVGNNSPDFIIPVDSKDNKRNIANFFDNAAKKANNQVGKDNSEKRTTVNHDSSENHAPLPVPDRNIAGGKRKQDDSRVDLPVKTRKTNSPAKTTTPPKAMTQLKTRSAVSNEGSTMKKTPTKKAEPGAQKITNFFGK